MRTDDVFGRWTVLRAHPGEVKCLCRCECGEERSLFRSSVTSGASRSCGCLRREVSTTACLTHGHAGTLTHRIWKAMRKRCKPGGSSTSANWGDRGITVCDRWGRFENFLADMGLCPPGMSIDRLDNDGNYEPGNCRWATRIEQHQNTRRTRRHEFQGARLTLREISDRTGVPRRRIENRLRRGWPVEQAVLPHLCQRFSHRLPRKSL